MFAETVVKTFSQICVHVFPDVDGNWSVGAERAKIVKTSDVVIMAVGHKDSVDIAYVVG